MSTRAFATATARRLFRENGLDGWRFGFDSAYRRFGQCNYSQHKITLSGVTLATRTDEEVEQTLIHEVAHALTRGHGHDHVWLTKARSLGYKGGRCSMSNERTVEVTAAAAPWLGTCADCEQSYPRFRTPPAGRSYVHPACRRKPGGGRITWTRNA